MTEAPGWSGPAKRLSIYIGEGDRHGSHSLASEVVHLAHQSGLAGVSVFRGIEGYGRSNHVHTTRILSLSDDLPLCIVVVDRAEAIEEFAERIVGLVKGGLITVEDVQVISHVGPQRQE